MDLENVEGVKGDGQAAVDQVVDKDGNRMVPLSALEGVREELKQTKESAAMLKGQVELYRANGATTQHQDTEPELLEGLEDNDVVTAADVRKIMANQDAKFSAVARQLRTGIGAPDYETVIEKYLPIVLGENPELADAIKTSSNPVALALTLAKSSDKYRKDKQEADLKDAGNQKQEGLKSEGDQILDNIQNKPGAASTGIGAGGGVSAVDKILKMSDDELEAKIAEIEARG